MSNELKCDISIISDFKMPLKQSDMSSKEQLLFKGVIRIHTSRKHRQHTGQKKKDKRTNNDL